MPKTWIIILSILGGLVLLAIIIIGGLTFWVSQNKDQWLKSAEKAGVEAKEFGAKTDHAGCLKEAMDRYRRDNSLSAQISTNLFLKYCLEESAPSPGFCDGVPARDEIMKSVTWTLDRCIKEELSGDQGCQRLHKIVQEFCNQTNVKRNQETKIRRMPDDYRTTQRDQRQ